jgi:hypothetical protein
MLPIIPPGNGRLSWKLQLPNQVCISSFPFALMTSGDVGDHNKIEVSKQSSSESADAVIGELSLDCRQVELTGLIAADQRTPVTADQTKDVQDDVWARGYPEYKPMTKVQIQQACDLWKKKTAVLQEEITRLEKRREVQKQMMKQIDAEMEEL